MPKRYSSHIVLKVLQSLGFEVISQRGSHIKLRNKSSAMHTVIVPANRKEIPVGTFKSILRQANLTEKVFSNY